MESPGEIRRGCPPRSLQAMDQSPCSSMLRIRWNAREAASWQEQAQARNPGWGHLNSSRRATARLFLAQGWLRKRGCQPDFLGGDVASYVSKVGGVVFLWWFDPSERENHKMWG